jgi:hypothetical protein
VNAQARTGGSPEQMLKGFYAWYMHELNANRDPRTQKAKINSAVSSRLRTWFRSDEYKDWDADYFIDAQDFYPKWERGVSTSKARISGDKADINVTLSAPGRPTPGFGPHLLKVKMVREGGTWKIDRINGN